MILKLQQAFLPDKLSPSAFSAQRLEQPPVHYPPKPGKSQAVEHWASLAQFTRDKHSKNATNGYSQGMRGGGCLLLSWFYCKLQVWGFFFLFFFDAGSQLPLPYEGCVHICPKTEEPSATVKLPNSSCLADMTPTLAARFDSGRQKKVNVMWHEKYGQVSAMN